MTYNWPFPQWAEFTYDASVLDSLLTDIAFNFGELNGLSGSLTLEDEQETWLNLMISEAQKTSEIEGEFFSRQDIMSSLKKQLRIGVDPSPIRDRKAMNVANLMLEVRASYQKTLSEEMLQIWHKILMKDDQYIHAGVFRQGEEPMQIVSGRLGNETVHYEAPPSKDVPLEMRKFVEWYTDFEVLPKDIKQVLIKTAIAHLYFESIHPFEDGNGRIGRAIIEKCLSESLGKPVLISVSVAIEKDKKNYYKQLNKASKTLEVTDWLLYFTELILSAQQLTKEIVKRTLNKSQFMDKYSSSMNDRQLKVVLKMFDYGAALFKGDMTAQKYQSIAKTSKATATRDLQDLTEKGALLKTGSGRGVKYKLNL